MDPNSLRPAPEEREADAQNRAEDADLEALRRLEREEGLPELLLETLAQHMPSGLRIVDAPGGRPIFANRQLEAIWRRPVAPAGDEDPLPLAGFHADGRPYLTGEWPVTRALSSGRAVPAEDIEIVRGDGTRATARVNALPVCDVQGDVVAAIETWVDVTEQRRRYSSRKFLAEAGSLVTSVDLGSAIRALAALAVPTLADWCTIDLLNPEGTLQRFAVEHADRKKSGAARDLARHAARPADGDVDLLEVVQSKRPRLFTEMTPAQLERLRQCRPEMAVVGEQGLSSMMILPLVTHGTLLGAISFITAESGRRYSPQDLEEAEELAAAAALAIENTRLFNESRAATEAKSDFLAVISHELRTPLTAIIGYAELLQLGVPEPVTSRQREQAERIEVSARHLLQMIEEILSLVTLESGESRVHQDEVDINELLRHAHSIIEPMAKAKNLGVKLSLAEGDPTVRSDADKLLQILLNLLSNAVKFTESGEITLGARVEQDAIVFDVMDTGIGLGPDHLRQIFKPFWQVERPITRRAGGTGLGLTISRRLADLLGANIEVKSEIGKGSTFSVRLPLEG